MRHDLTKIEASTDNMSRTSGSLREKFSGHDLTNAWSGVCFGSLLEWKLFLSSSERLIIQDASSVNSLSGWPRVSCNLSLLAILWITTITCEIDMEWIWNAITGKTFVLIFANRKKDIYKLLFKKKKIIISFYSILFLNPNWPFVLCWFYDPVFTKWLSAFPLF